MTQKNQAQLPFVEGYFDESPHCKQAYFKLFIKYNWIKTNFMP